MSSRRRGALTLGVVLAGAGVLAIVTFVGVAGVRLNSATSTLGRPALATPMHVTQALADTDYAVFELTGHRGGAGPITVRENDAPTVTPDDVTVTAPDGSPIPTRGPGSGTETFSRDHEIYTAAVYFRAPVEGAYRIWVNGDGSHRVLVNRSTGGQFRDLLRLLPLLFTAAPLVVTGTGLILLAVRWRPDRPTPH
jgi:hypothetical protein